MRKVAKKKRLTDIMMDGFRPFNEFRNIEYLPKDGFGEVHKATWINCYYFYHKKEYKEDILKKVKV